MKALNNSISTSVPSTLVIEYIKLYKLIGLSEGKLKELKDLEELYTELTKKEDIISLYRFLRPESSLSETRMESFLSRKGNLVTKNEDERFLVNLIKTMDQVYLFQDFNTDDSEYKALGRTLYDGVKEKNNFLKKSSKNDDTYEEKLEAIFKLYNRLVRDNQIEYTNLNISLFLDLLVLEPFKEGNFDCALIFLYCLTLKNEMKCYKYTSFFKQLLDEKEEFNSALNIAFKRYNDGYPDINPLINFFLKLYYKAYDNLDLIYLEMERNGSLGKIDTVITTIYKLNGTFTKEDIQKANPHISKTTIDRALAKLKDDGKISPFGRGRGSKWVMIDDSYNKNGYLFGEDE